MTNENDAEAKTVGEFMMTLLSILWEEGESFSGKRPLGNSDWYYQIYLALLMNEAIKGEYVVYDGYTQLEECDGLAAHKLIAKMLKNITVKS